MHYAYRAPRWPIDVTSPVGAAQAERIAEVEATFVREAEALARLVLAGSGAEPVIPATEMQRTRNWKEADALCRRFARTR